MTNYDLSIHCCFCSTTHKVKLDLPEGWAHRYDGHDDESNAFCPEHSKVAAFAEAQCPGCVGGWGDCDMWRAFAYGSQRRISEADYAALEKGICPRRTNGTLGFSGGKMESLDLSSRAPSESGVAFADAIREYLKKYPSAA